MMNQAALANPTLSPATSKCVQQVLMKLSPMMKASPRAGGRSSPMIPTTQTVLVPSVTLRMQSSGLRTYLSDPKVKMRSGRLGRVAQSTCFSFPGPNPAVIFSTTWVGPTITDVPVSMIPIRLLDVLQLVPLKTTSVMSRVQQFFILRGQYLKSSAAYLELTPPKTRADPSCPAVLVKQKENEFPSTCFCSQRRSKMTGISRTEMVLQAIPKIPSNLEAKKEIPSSLVICPKREFAALNPANEVVS